MLTGTVLAATTNESLQLALDLFAEGNWSQAQTEGRRLLREHPSSAPAELLVNMAALRLGQEEEALLASLRQLAARQDLVEIRSMAAYELGRLLWKQDRPQEAAAYLRQAFLETRSMELFARSGCSLYQLTRRFPHLGKKDPLLFQSLETARPLWTADVWKECAPPSDSSSPRWLSLPGRWIVGFYRSAIRPAIGDRCSLEPSCSEYLLLASRKHGLLGIPMMADRLIREPSVVSAAEHPRMHNGHTTYADPVEDHDGWLGGKKP